MIISSKIVIFNLILVIFISTRSFSDYRLNCLSFSFLFSTFPCNLSLFYSFACHTVSWKNGFYVQCYPISKQQLHVDFCLPQWIHFLLLFTVRLYYHSKHNLIDNTNHGIFTQSVHSKLHYLHNITQQAQIKLLSANKLNVSAALSYVCLLCICLIPSLFCFNVHISC